MAPMGSRIAWAAAVAFAVGCDTRSVGAERGTGLYGNPARGGLSLGGCDCGGVAGGVEPSSAVALLALAGTGSLTGAAAASPDAVSTTFESPATAKIVTPARMLLGARSASPATVPEPL